MQIRGGGQIQVITLSCKPSEPSEQPTLETLIRVGGLRERWNGWMDIRREVDGRKREKREGEKVDGWMDEWVGG